VTRPDTRTGAAPGAGPPAARLGPVFTVVAAGVAMSNLDTFIVNVALPEIGEDLSGSSLSALSWVLNAYAVVFAALLVPLGDLADRAGARRAYLLGTAIFTVASALCALAPSVWALVAARIAQAAGAAMLTPASLGLLLAAAPPERRTAAVRGWTAISGLAAALGPVAGGLLCQVDWRWAFLINLPVGVAAVVAGLRVLPRTPAARDARHHDLAGAGVLTIAVAALALGLVRGEEWGWSSAKVIGCLVAAVLLAAVFAIRSARHPDPIVPPALLRVPAFGSATLANVLFAVAFAAMLLSAVLWCQEMWRWSPLRTGLAIAPGPLMVPALAVGAGSIVRRVGPAPVAAAGCALFAAGIGWWAVALRPDGGYLTGLLPGMLLTGVGVGLTLPTLISAAVAALPPRSFATGSAVVTMARQVGMVLGVAMLVAALGSPEGTEEAHAAFDGGWLLTLGATAAAGAVASFIRRGQAA